MPFLRVGYRIAMDAFYRFNADDGWAIASHIALSALMSLFPFLILVTALAGFLFGSTQLADEVANILLEIWPKEVAAPIAGEIRRVLLGARGDLLTIGVALAIYFASAAIESLRIGLNRAYGVSEHRTWWVLRLEVDRLRAAGRCGAAGAVVSGRARAADFYDHAPLYAGALRAGARAAVAHVQLPADHGGGGRPDRCIGDRAQMAARRAAATDAYRSGDSRDAGAVAHRRRAVRRLSRPLRLHLCQLLCRPRLGDDRAGVSLPDRLDLHLRRRAQRLDPPLPRASADARDDRT